MKWAYSHFLKALTFVIAWVVWRNISPVAPGHILGHYEVYGRYNEGKLYKDIKGLLVDATNLFINSRLMTGFKRMVRIVVTRDRLTEHMLVQFGHVDPINVYASTELERNKFGFGHGFMGKGRIGATMHTLPEPVDFNGIDEMS